MTVLLLLATAGCVKQKNCDCAITGTFVYLEQSYEKADMCPSTSVVAHLIIDSYDTLLIVGKVPKKFRTNDSIPVNVCLKSLCKSYLTVALPEGYSLECIEKKED
ncbi:MAG: hypothetical protein LBH92_03025 [Bacteroidales bacterium]|nr:hypothetical protein [Bacteroidales bacterium]